jgi:hypothetical protein
LKESRLLELMRNDDGTLSIFSTLVDHAGPASPPPPGTRAGAIGNEGIASISRQFAARVKGLDGPEVNQEPAAGATHFRDPRRYW